MMRILLLCLFIVPLVVSATPAQNGGRDVEKQPPPPLTNVKSTIRTKASAYTKSYTGVVTEIDDKQMRVDCSGDDIIKPGVRVFYPLDLMVKGEVTEGGFDCEAYRWQDVQKGDTISVSAVVDKEENLEYITGIMIRLRPKGKIPPSQKPSKRGVPYHVEANVKNDIENGLDVDEEEIKKAFPFKRDPEFPNLAVLPDSLPEKYRKKLEANRERIAKEKKDKELKAKSADPKKDDKK